MVNYTNTIKKKAVREVAERKRSVIIHGVKKAIICVKTKREEIKVLRYVLKNQVMKKRPDLRLRKVTRIGSYETERARSVKVTLKS